jgi:MHS family proline/betaine transporter-like MFS transporter
MAVASTRRKIAGASIGNLAECYDFFVFGFTAPVLALHFFPESNPTAALLGTFAIYAVAFLARPLGGVLFGCLGDRSGRVSMMSLTVLLIGGATMVIGLLPTYQEVGFLATVLLVIVRLLQGLSLGGEASGSYSFMLESAPAGKRAFWVSIAACSAFLPATFAALVVFGIRATMGTEAFEDWGWRLPFFLGGALGVAGVWIRRRLTDPDEFVEAVRQAPVDNPIRTVVGSRLRTLINVAALSSVHAVTNYLVLGYLYTYRVKTAGLTDGEALVANSVAICGLALLFLVFGRLSDRVGRKPLLLAGTIWIVVFAVPAFKLVASGTLAGAYAGQFLIVVPAAMCTSAGFTTQLELFPTRMRYAGHAIASNVGNAFFGGTAPLIAAALVGALATPIAPAYYAAAIGVFGVIVVLFTPETSRVDLRDSVGAPVPSPTDQSRSASRR